MGSSIGDEVKKLYEKELSVKPGSNAGRGSKLLAGIVVGIPVVAVLAFLLVTVHYFNTFIALEQEIFAQGSRIEKEYQRRADLIPKLIGITTEYAEHERALFKYVSDTRELKNAMQKLGSALGASKSADFDKSLSKLMALAEQYPDLKATQSFQDLMEKIENTENRIASMRESYSIAINNYTTVVQSFPGNLFASYLPFDSKLWYHPGKEPMPLRNKRIFFRGAADTLGL